LGEAGINKDVLRGGTGRTRTRDRKGFACICWRGWDGVLTNCCLMVKNLS